jgi:alcohol dehydrogenase (quinone), cytochrome c subunit
VVEAGSPESVISIIFRGSSTPRTPQTSAQFTMPGFAWRLSDIEVMQVTNFVRGNWGNRAEEVTLADVTRLRPESSTARN